MRAQLAAAAAAIAVPGFVVTLLLAGAGMPGEQPTVAGGVCAPAASYGTGAIAWPMAPGSYRLTSGYGMRWGTLHAGIDMAAPIGTPITSAHDGVVAAAGPASGFGLWVIVNGTDASGQPFSTVYGHVDQYFVTVGEAVRTGQRIAVVGNRGQSTGPHLHFEVWPGTRLGGGRSIDPAGWLAGATAPVAPPVAAPPPAAAASLPGQATMPISAEQERNVEIITGVVKGRGLPLRAAVIAVGTAMQESRLINIDYGDRDSVGLFQQRPSQGWGTVAQILDPVYSTGKFLDGLVRVPGWETLALTDAAQRVQRSGFPLAYAKWETQAVGLVAAAAGVDPITAGIGPAPSPCGPAAL